MHLAHAKLLVCPHRNAPFVDAMGRKTLWDYRHHSISCLDPQDLLSTHEVSNGKAGIIHVGAPILATTPRGDLKRPMASGLCSCELAHAESIQTVGFLHAESGPVPPRSPPAPGGERNAQCPECVTERIPGGIDGGGSAPRLLCLCFHLGMTELCGSLSTLRRVALMATEYEVGHTIRPASAARVEMVQFERRVLAAAVHTHIELHALDINPLHRRPPLVPPGPGNYK